jgi:hypothetical protein
MPGLREYLLRTFPAAASLTEDDLSDPSPIDELDESGFIEELYAGGEDRSYRTSPAGG